MAKTLYTAAANGLDTGDYAWTTGTWKVSLVSSAYAFSAAHDFYNDLSGVLATATISGNSKSSGVWDATDPEWLSVASGNSAAAIVIWKDTGNVATSPLLLYDDTLLGLPYATDGGNIALRWNDGASKILKIPTTITTA